MSSTVADDRQVSSAEPGNAGVRRFGKATWALAVAFVALASSASSLLFTFLPQLKPDPRDSVAAQLSIFGIDPGVSLGDYIQQAYGGEAAAPAGFQFPRQELTYPGDMVYVRTRVDGFKHRRVRLTASLYNAATQRLIPLPQQTLDARTVELDTPSTATVQLFWILSLYGEPPTFVRVEMFDGTRMLAVADSPVIRNNLAPRPPA
jgi:hypothetical protein